jgi:hypothetical protein
MQTLHLKILAFDKLVLKKVIIFTGSSVPKAPVQLLHPPVNTS